MWPIKLISNYQLIISTTILHVVKKKFGNLLDIKLDQYYVSEISVKTMIAIGKL